MSLSREKKPGPLRPGFLSAGLLFSIADLGARVLQRERHREALDARSIEGGAFVCPRSRSVEIPLESPEIA